MDEASINDTHEWRINQDSRLTNLERAVGGIKEDMGAMREGQKNTFNAITELKSALGTVSKPKETQWGVLISLCGLIVIIGGGFTTLTVAPIQHQIIRDSEINEKQSEQIVEFHRFMGASEQWRESTRREIDLQMKHIQEFEAQALTNAKTTGYQEGKIESLESQLNAVDFNGSRKWVKKTEQPVTINEP